MALSARQNSSPIRDGSDQLLDTISWSFRPTSESLHRGAVAKTHFEDGNYVLIIRPVLQSTFMNDAVRYWNKARLEDAFCMRVFLRVGGHAPLPSLVTRECRILENSVESVFEYQQRMFVPHSMRIAEEFSNVSWFPDKYSKQQQTSFSVDSFFKRELYSWNEPIPCSVMAKGALGVPISSGSLMDDWALWTDKRQTGSSAVDFSVFLLYIRHPLTFELGHWSKGSREILQKSRYSRMKLLQEMTALNIVCHISLKHEMPLVSSASHGSEELGSLPDTLEHLTQLYQERSLVSRRWKKFLVALEKELYEESQVDDQRRTGRLRGEIFLYDTPRRIQSLTCREFIWTRYELTKKRKPNEPLHKLPSENLNEIVSRDRNSDDMLSLFSLSDEPSNDYDVGGKLGALFDSQTKQRRACIDGSSDTGEEMVDLCTSSQGGQDHGEVIATKIGTTSHVDHHNHDIGLGQNNRTSLKPLNNLVCSPWNLKIAEFCIQKMTRGVVFLPPPLSSFPSVALIVHSFISETLCDSRVVIICEPETEMPLALQGYLNFLFEERISIQTIRRCQRARFPAPASLAKTLSRIVILDSFDFTDISGFSLLLVLGPGTTSLPALACARRGQQNAVSSSVGAWTVIPSILIFPHHACNPVQDFLSEATRLASALHVDEALFIDDVDDVHLSVLLSRPDFVFLVPSRETLEVVSTLEAYASSHLQRYELALREVQNDSVCYCNVDSLNDVKLDVLEMHLTRECALVDEQHETFEILFALKQARSYALYDGVQTAIDYLNHNARTATMGAATVLKSLLSEIQKRTSSDSSVQSKIHPMTAALKSSLDVMKKQDDEEAPSLRSIHRREKFRPLIIAHSKEAYDGLLRAMPGASDILDAKGLVAVCENRHLRITERTDRRLSAYKKAVQREITQFSHVILVLDDRTTATSCELIPPKLLESVHAGKIRLVTITVDESRTLEHLWSQNESLYSIMCTITRSATDQQITQCSQPYMLHTSLSWFTSHDFTKLVYGKIIARPEPTNAGKLSIQTHRRDERMHFGGHSSLLSVTQEGSTEFLLTPSVICNLSTVSLGSRLKDALSKIRAKLRHKHRFRVVIQVDENEKYTPAATYVFATLASDEYLHRHVEVVFR